MVAERSDPLSLYNRSTGLFRQQLNLASRELNLTEVVQVIKPFYERELQDFPQFRNIVVIPALAGIFLVWLAAYFHEKRELFHEKIEA